MQFDVRTLSPDHLVARLLIEARDERDARRQVEARGLYATSVRPAAPALGGALGSRRSRAGLSLILFSQELLALLEAGLSINEALEALLEKEAVSSARSVLSQLLAGLSEGKRFSGVLAEQPELFSPLYVGIVRAAEGTSDLPRALARFIDYQQRNERVRARIVSAAIYPMILLAVGAAVSGFLIGYVVPRFAEVYQGSGRELPWLSQKLLDWGQFAGAHGAVLWPAVGVTAICLVAWLRRLAATGGAARLARRLPGLGERVRVIELSRLYLTLGMLIEGGIPIIAAIDTVLTIPGAGIRAGLMSARTCIEAGLPLSVAFEAGQLTTPISLRMLRVGERTGAMGRMLTQSAAFYDGEINRWIDRFTRTFEPLLMAAIGLVVGTIVVLLYMPIFDLAGSMQ